MTATPEADAAGQLRGDRPRSGAAHEPASSAARSRRARPSRREPAAGVVVGRGVEGEALAGARGDVAGERVDVADGARLGQDRPSRRGALHPLLQRAVHARDGQAGPEGGGVADGGPWPRAGVDHLVRRRARSERDRPEPSWSCPALGWTPMRSRNSSTAAAPLSCVPTPLRRAPSRRSSISVCRFWLVLLTALRRSPTAAGSRARPGRARWRAAASRGRSALPGDHDPLRGEHLREHGGRVAGRVLEGHRALPGPLRRAACGARRCGSGCEPRSRSRRRSAGRARAATWSRWRRRGSTREAASALDDDRVALPLARRDRQVGAVVVEGEGRDLGAVPPDEVAPRPVLAAAVAREQALVPDERAPRSAARPAACSASASSSKAAVARPSWKRPDRFGSPRPTR